MLPLDLPPGTTIESLVTEAIPAMHARLAGEGGPKQDFTVAVRVEGLASWTVHIRGREMRVVQGEAQRPTLWMHTTAEMADRFLADALGPRRLVPEIGSPSPAAGSVLTLTDPRVVSRVAMASGRIELAARDAEGGRLAVVFGFGNAARKPIDPDDPDTVLEVSVATLHRVLRGECGPEEALSSHEVTVRGSRLLAMQLAFAIGPFYPKRA